MEFPSEIYRDAQPSVCVRLHVWWRAVLIFVALSLACVTANGPSKAYSIASLLVGLVTLVVTFASREERSLWSRYINDHVRGYFLRLTREGDVFTLIVGRPDRGWEHRAYAPSSIPGHGSQRSRVQLGIKWSGWMKRSFIAYIPVRHSAGFYWSKLRALSITFVDCAEQLDRTWDVRLQVRDHNGNALIMTANELHRLLEEQVQSIWGGIEVGAIVQQYLACLPDARTSSGEVQDDDPTVLSFALQRLDGVPRFANTPEGVAIREELLRRMEANAAEAVGS